MNEPQDRPSIVIWIAEDTQLVKVDFRPQHLQPAEYGIVISSLLVHIARLFVESNAHSTEDKVLGELTRGIAIGLAQRKDLVLPSKAH